MNPFSFRTSPRASLAWTSLLVAAVGATASLVGCSSDDASTPAPATCEAHPVERFKELEIVDEAVIGDARAKNATGGPWSFRHAVEEMVPAGMSSSDFVGRWLELWSNATRVNTATVAPRPLVRSKLICPWLRSTPSNECNTDCSVCTAKEFDLAKAPFRLLAIVNRMDEGPKTPGGPGTGESGEGRLVFGMTNGPADDPASVPMAMTLIYEFELIGAPKFWAEKWHALGTFPEFDESYKVALEGVTNAYVNRGSKPSGPSGNGISTIRTNEREFEWQWEMREFRLSDDGLFLGPLANTPDVSLNGSPALTDFLLQNRSVVLTEKFALPTSLRGATTRQGFRWSFDGVDEPLRGAFARQTCNGCHQGEQTPVDANFHVSPFKSGVEKLSLFVNNPADPAHDALASRALGMSALLCGP